MRTLEGRSNPELGVLATMFPSCVTAENLKDYDGLVSLFENWNAIYCTRFGMKTKQDDT